MFRILIDLAKGEIRSANLLKGLFTLNLPFLQGVFQQHPLIFKNLEEYCTKSGGKTLLFVIILEEEVTDGVRS